MAQTIAQLNEKAATLLELLQDVAIEAHGSRNNASSYTKKHAAQTLTLALTATNDAIDRLRRGARIKTGANRNDAGYTELNATPGPQDAPA